MTVEMMIEEKISKILEKNLINLDGKFVKCKYLCRTGITGFRCCMFLRGEDDIDYEVGISDVLEVEKDKNRNIRVYVRVCAITRKILHKNKLEEIYYTLKHFGDDYYCQNTWFGFTTYYKDHVSYLISKCKEFKINLNNFEVKIGEVFLNHYFEDVKFLLGVLKPYKKELLR